MRKALTAALLTLAASFTIVAQQPSPAPPQPQRDAATQQPGARRHARRMRGMRMLMRARRHERARALRELNLSQQQRERIRTLRQGAFESTRPQREELRQLLMARRQAGGQLNETQQARARQLRQELRAAHGRPA